MHITNKMANSNILQIVTDFIFLCFSYLIAYFSASILTTLYQIKTYLWILILFIPFWMSSMAFLGMYNKMTFQYLDRVFRSVIISTIYSGVLLASLFFFVKEGSVSRIFIGIFLIVCVIVMFFQRCVFRLVYKNTQLEHPGTTRILIVGNQQDSSEYRQYLKKTSLRCMIVGYVQVDNNSSTLRKNELGRLENLENILKEHVVDEVVFALPKNFIGDLEYYLQLCETMGVTARVLANFYNLQLSKIHISMLGTIPVLTYHTVTLNNLQKSIKRLIDIIGALVGILITLIASLFIVPAIILDSPGPVLFRQLRVGLNGRKFYIYKFRTMIADAEQKKKNLMAQNQYADGRFFKIENDPRITKVGRILRKTSLDELPQFFNVLVGDMSLVGTRPPTVDEVEKYEPNHWRRISIKPGITGMWQVSGRSSIKDFEKIVELDSEYIDRWSVAMDIRIMLKTLGLVFSKKSAAC
ncbi:MAG: sugar transferase [Clostridia bacterium]|nr:sugar transferase [Clostridia bacterium]